MERRCPPFCIRIARWPQHRRKPRRRRMASEDAEASVSAPNAHRHLSTDQTRRSSFRLASSHWQMPLCGVGSSCGLPCPETRSCRVPSPEAHVRRLRPWRLHHALRAWRQTARHGNLRRCTRRAACQMRGAESCPFPIRCRWPRQCSRSATRTLSVRARGMDARRTL